MKMFITILFSLPVFIFNYTLTSMANTIFHFKKDAMPLDLKSHTSLVLPLKAGSRVSVRWAFMYLWNVLAERFLYSWNSM